MSIEVQCFTNIDVYKHEKWPTAMVAIPEKGQLVAAESGKVLQVVGITHAVWKPGSLFPEKVGRPYLQVELHMPNGLPIPKERW